MEKIKQKLSELNKAIRDYGMPTVVVFRSNELEMRSIHGCPISSTLSWISDEEVFAMENIKMKRDEFQVRTGAATADFP